MRSVKIAPSILSADFSRLGEELVQIQQADADWVHIDVMDGHFVPNLTIGPLIVEAVRRVVDDKHLNMMLDVHLMIEMPERYIDDFIYAGADALTIHIESTPHLHRALQMIRKHEKRPAVALNPLTPIHSLCHVFPYVDMILLMTVNPGFGGQTFIEEMIPKIKELQKMIDKDHGTIDLEVDGGVNIGNIARLWSAGANVFVAGNAIFKSQNYKQTIQNMRAEIEKTSLIEV